MEITRQFKPAIATQSESTVAAAATPVATRKATAAQPQSLPLEQLHDALGSLPDVDMDKVEQIKAALQRGEIKLDIGALSRSMLAYHNGSDA